MTVSARTINENKELWGKVSDDMPTAKVSEAVDEFEKRLDEAENNNNQQNVQVFELLTEKER